MKKILILLLIAPLFTEAQLTLNYSKPITDTMHLVIITDSTVAPAGTVYFTNTATVSIRASQYVIVRYNEDVFLNIKQCKKIPFGLMIVPIWLVDGVWNSNKDLQ